MWRVGVAMAETDVAGRRLSPRVACRRGNAGRKNSESKGRVSERRGRETESKGRESEWRGRLSHGCILVLCRTWVRIGVEIRTAAPRIQTSCEGCLVVRSGHGPQAEVAQGFGPEPLVEH